MSIINTKNDNNQTEAETDDIYIQYIIILLFCINFNSQINKIIPKIISYEKYNEILYYIMFLYMKRIIG